ncbi:hypothetical protein BTM25_43180 [Actinomadura rubteroloni]|uniref:Uncharacterized protein n=1 Tax=Actinomadura rubteroloni TaxID=1926885 RepID=A0A2P4UDR0_9ACTN|nr:hypothetical protein [Actinomadura rubteroloni]POM23166.1 hypothetical protein BTM25_43180 [Actinomadura rubteroloni]
MSQATPGSGLLEDTRHIPPPDPDLEPLKVSVYERMAKAAAQLMPLFPYDHAGAIIPCGNVLIGGPENAYGHFFHWNTVNEVVAVYGSHKSLLATGQIMATQNLHGVNSFLRDEKDPEAFAVIVVTQHQSVEGGQTEAMIARCKKCKAELIRHEYDATPHGLPGYDAERHGGPDDPVHQFSTALGSAEFADLRNTDEIRVCAGCGHANDPFPSAQWGWARQVAQTRAVNAASQSLIQTAASAEEDRS